MPQLLTCRRLIWRDTLTWQGQSRESIVAIHLVAECSQYVNRTLLVLSIPNIYSIDQYSLYIYIYTYPPLKLTPSWEGLLARSYVRCREGARKGLCARIHHVHLTHPCVCNIYLVQFGDLKQTLVYKQTITNDNKRYKKSTHSLLPNVTRSFKCFE